MVDPYIIYMSIPFWGGVLVQTLWSPPLSKSPLLLRSRRLVRRFLEARVVLVSGTKRRSATQGAGWHEEPGGNCLETPGPTDTTPEPKRNTEHREEGGAAKGKKKETA